MVGICQLLGQFGILCIATVQKHKPLTTPKKYFGAQIDRMIFIHNVRHEQAKTYAHYTLMDF